MSCTDSLARYHLLGRSGLRVSPLALGTMTFGTEWGWGNTAEVAESIMARYREAGGGSSLATPSSGVHRAGSGGARAGEVD